MASPRCSTKGILADSRSAPKYLWDGDDETSDPRALWLVRGHRHRWMWQINDHTFIHGQQLEFWRERLESVEHGAGRDRCGPHVLRQRNESVSRNADAIRAESVL